MSLLLAAFASSGRHASGQPAAPPAEKTDAGAALRPLFRAEALMAERDYAGALEALESVPAGDIFTDYYRGVCLEAVGRAAEARAVLGGVAVRADAPAEIAADCRARLLALEGREEAKRFRVWWRGGYEYDSNVTLQPDDTSLVVPSGKDDFRFTNEAGVWVRGVDRERFALDTEYDFFNTVHNQLGEFNMLGHELSETLTVKGDRVRPYVGYGYGYYWLDDCAQSYLRRHRLYAGAEVPEGRSLLAQFMYELRYNDYFLSFTEPEDNWSGHNDSFGLNQYWFPGVVKGSVARVGAFYDRESAIGNNYFYDGWRFEGEYGVPLGEAMWVDVQAAYYHREYPRNDAGRTDNEQRYGATVSRALTEHFTVSGQYGLWVNDSTEGLFEYDRNIFSLFCTVSF